MKKQDAFTRKTGFSSQPLDNLSLESSPSNYAISAHNTKQFRWLQPTKFLLSVASRRFKSIIQQLLPHHCRLCDAEANDYLCQPCCQSLPRLLNNTCIQCALPLASQINARKGKERTEKKSTAYENHQQVCGECLKHNPHYDRTICVFNYDFPLNDLVHNFKDQAEISAGKYLTLQLIDKLQKEYAQQILPQALVAVPMHWRKLLLRGFNQSEIIAREITCAFDIPIILPIKKYIPTASQHQLNRRERQRNLNISFSLHKNAYDILKGIEHIALIDDVVTTGATTNTLAKMLKKAGVKQVDVWALARTPTHT